MSEVGHSLDSAGSKSNKKLITVVAVFAVLIIALLAVVIFLLLSKEDVTEEKKASGRPTVVTEENVEEFQQPTEKVQDGAYTTSMSIDWHFKGKESTDAYVANVTENTRTVYFDLIRTDTSETIYSSPFIPVGSELKGVTLDTELAPGTYDTILVYHLVDDEENELSTLSIALTIYVE